MSFANLQVGLGLDSLFHAGTGFHQNVLNQVTFYQRVQLRDQDSKGQNIAGEDYDTLRH